MGASLKSAVAAECGGWTFKSKMHESVCTLLAAVGIAVYIVFIL